MLTHLLRKIFDSSWPIMSNLLSESTLVRIHSGGVLINIKCVGDHEVDDSIVHLFCYLSLWYSDENFWSVISWNKTGNFSTIFTISLLFFVCKLFQIVFHCILWVKLLCCMMLPHTCAHIIPMYYLFSLPHFTIAWVT